MFVVEMKKSIFYLIIFLGGYQWGFSQIKIENQFELGVNSSGLPNLNKRNLPVISPVAGYWAKVKFGKHFSYNLGIQYLKVGATYYEKRVRVNEYYDYTSEQWRSISFQKLSVPIVIGYDFKIKKITSTLYLGVKRNYFLNGEVIERFKFVDRKDPNRNSDDTRYVDPFAEGWYMSPVSRWNSGVFVGCAIVLHKKLNANLNYSMGQNSSYSRGCLGYSYTNNDLTVSLRYSIFSN